MRTITKAAFERFASDPSAFRSELIVDVDGAPTKFGRVMDDWQRADFEAMDSALKRCNGRSEESAVMRHYRERGRGSSKTTDLAVTAVWAMAFSTRPIRGYCYAADKDQAALLKDAVATILRLNPWLGSLIEVQKDVILNVGKGHPGIGSKLVIETSDVASSYGILPDLIIADELTHWIGDGKLWHSLISSAAKRATCLFVVISNAGFAETWQWEVREAARTDESWHFSRLDGPKASWMPESRLAEQRRMLPHLAYARLWLNEWSAAGGDALTPEDIEAAFDSKLRPMSGRDKFSFDMCGLSEGIREQGSDFVQEFFYVAGVDLGLTRDASAVVVLAVPTGGSAGDIFLAHNKLWKPIAGRKVDLLEVQQHLLELDEEFGLEHVAFDPWQAEHLAATLEADSGRRRRNQRRFWAIEPWARSIPPTAANLREQCSHTIESFGDRRLKLYPCEPLRRDLLKLRVEETASGGLRLRSPRDGDGHGDTFSAFALALVLAHEVSLKRKKVAGGADARSRVGAVGQGATAYDRWMKGVERRAQQFEQDQLKGMARSADDRRAEGLHEMLKRAGYGNRIPKGRR